MDRPPWQAQAQQQRNATMPPPPGAPPAWQGGPPRPAAAGAPAEVEGSSEVYQQEQEKKILAHNVSQAIQHLVHTHKQMTGEPVSVEATLKQQPPGLTARKKVRTEEYFTRQGSADGSAPPTDGQARFRVEFAPAYLNFIPELSVLLLSCLLPVLAISGRNVLATLLVGLVTTYIFDYTNSKRMTLLSAWLCIGGVWLGLYFSNVHLLFTSWLNVFLLLNASLYLFVLGVCASIQFKWLQLQVPELALAAERILLGLSPFVCLPLIFTTLVSLIGSQTAPFYFTVILCGLHKVFYTLKKSAFKASLSPDARREEYINGKPEAFLFTLFTFCLPVALELIINFKEPLSMLVFLNLMTLVLGPMLYLFYKPRDSLWFLYRNAYGDRPTADDILNLRSVRGIILVAAYLTVLHWLIYRVVFGRFAHLLAGVAPPFNVILVSIAAYCGSAVIYWGTDLAERQQSDMTRAARWCGILLFSIVAAVCFCSAAGFPRFAVCMAALGTSCLVAFCLDTRNLNNYLIFTIVTFVMLTWWMYKSFSFLTIELPIFGGTENISLPRLSVYILWLYMIQCIIFPLGISQPTAAFVVSLFQQVCLLAVIEHTLYSQPENMYPFYCVIGTTLWGMYFTHTLRRNKKLTTGQTSVLQGFFIAKLFLFFMTVTLPDPDSELFDHAYTKANLVLCFFLTAFMGSVVMQLYYESVEKRRRSSVVAFTALYTAAAGIVAFFSRFSMVIAILELLTDNSDVQAGRHLGLTLMFAGVLQLPLASLLSVSHGKPKRMCTAFLVIGAVIALMDPVFEGEATGDMEMDLYESPWWSAGLGIVAVTAVASTLLNVVTLPDSTAARIGWWSSVSIACGMSYTGLFIPYASWHAYLLISLVFGLIVLCIDFTHFSVSAQKDDSNTIWGLYTGALVTLLASLLDAQWRVPDELDRNLQYEAATQRQNAVLSLSIGINVLLAALIKMKLGERPILMPRDISRVDKMRETQGDGTLFGLLGNICVAQAYVSLLILRNDLGGGSPGFFVLLSPMLLMMHDDGWLFNGLADPEQLRRYTVPVVASLACMVWYACWIDLPALIAASPVYFALQLTIFMVAIAMGCAAAHDLWIDSKLRRRQGSTDAFIIIVGVVLFLMAGPESVRLTVGVALVAGILPLFNDSAWARRWSQVI